MADRPGWGEDFERVATTTDPALISWRQQVIADARKILNMNGTPTNDNIAYPAGHPFCLGGETPPAP